MDKLEKYLEDIIQLCEINHIKSLHSFGSINSDKFNFNSDIDLLIELDEKDPYKYTEKYFNFKFALEDLLKRKIDLIENKSIKNPILKEDIDKSKIKIYDRI